MEGDREHFLASGMDDYLSKPFDLQALRALLARWIPPSTDGETPDKLADVVTVDNDVDVLDSLTLKNLMEHYQGDKWPRFEKLLAMYKKSAIQQLATLEQAIVNADAKVIAQTAHSLKSSSGNLAAAKVAQACKVLEERARENKLAASVEQLAQIKVHFNNACNALDQLDYREKR